MVINGIKYMTDFEAKKAIIDIGQRMYRKGFVAANDGNISCRVGPNALWTTPTGVSKGFMTPDMLVKVDMNGKVLMGNRKPSSELKMHLRVYQENPQMMAVTHAHPPVSTAYAVSGIALEEPILTESVVNLGVVPIAGYAEPGTQEVPDSIAPYCKTHNAVLLANHGALTWGRDIYEAFYRLESVEYYATLLMYTGRIIGQQHPLSCDQIGGLIETRSKLGITGGGIPPCSVHTDNKEDVTTNRPKPAVAETPLKGVTPLVRPTGEQAGGCGCSVPPKPVQDTATAAKTKEQIIAEVVRRVVSEWSS